jgi:hypothetical protein
MSVRDQAERKRIYMREYSKVRWERVKDNPVLREKYYPNRPAKDRFITLGRYEEYKVYNRVKHKIRRMIEGCKQKKGLTIRCQCGELIETFLQPDQELEIRFFMREITEICKRFHA